MDTHPTISQYFYRKNDLIEENYINFKTIEMTIGNANNMEPFTLIYFGFINKTSQYSSYSNMIILGQIADEEPTNIATFYQKANKSYGLEPMFTNKTYLDKMKLKVVMKERVNADQWKMEVNIYIDKMFLLNLYEQESVPKFLFKIIKENAEDFRITKKNQHNYKTLDIAHYIPNTLIPLQNNYKIQQYKYQHANINWMIEKENNINYKKGLDTYELPENYYIYNIEEINERLICNDKCKILNLDELNKNTILFKGGVLSDEIGLGKTYSMLSLVIEQLNKEEHNTT